MDTTIDDLQQALEEKRFITKLCEEEITKKLKLEMDVSYLETGIRRYEAENKRLTYLLRNYDRNMVIVSGIGVAIGILFSIIIKCI